VPEVLCTDETGEMPSDLLELLASATTFVLRRELGAAAARAEVSVLVVTEARIGALNAQWRGIGQPTDVLSFPGYESAAAIEAEPDDLVLGDIVLCPAWIQCETEEARTRELVLLAVHGTLHLLGYDHADPEEEGCMFALQERYTEEVLAG
jgi:probable rRNA maturation factor